MSDISNSFGLVSVLEQSIHDRLVLTQAFARSAERAHSQSLTQMRQLRTSCSQFAAGLIQDFSIVARDGHLAAFEMMTYGETCASLGVRLPAACERLLQCGQALQDRVLSHETCYLDNELSPSDAFYDDLFPSDVMDMPHQFVVVNRKRTGDINQISAPQFLGFAAFGEEGVLPDALPDVASDPEMALTMTAS